MISFQRTRDLALVAAIMRHPRLYPHLSSDFAPPAEQFWPNPSPEMHYMIAYDGEALGLYTAHPIMSPITWEVHHAILPAHWRRTHEIAAAFETWLWSETPCQTAVGFTPTCNRLAVRYAEKHMERSGVIPKGYLKAGKLHDIVIFIKNKPIKI